MTYENLDAKLKFTPRRWPSEPAKPRRRTRRLGDDRLESPFHAGGRGRHPGLHPRVNYGGAAGFDVTAVIQLQVEGNALPDVTETLRDHRQMTSVYEVTGDYDVIAIGKFEDTDGMNERPDQTAADRPRYQGLEHQRRPQRRERERTVRPRGRRERVIGRLFSNTMHREQWRHRSDHWRSDSYSLNQMSASERFEEPERRRSPRANAVSERADD